MVFPYLLLCSYINESAQSIVNNGATVYAIRLSAIGLAITPDMGHDGWASDVALSNIHERSLITRRFHLYKNTKVSMGTPYECPTSKLGYLSFKLMFQSFI